MASRQPGTLPYPDLPAGTVNTGMPFDHLVVVMMENHSFDNLLGELSRTREDICGLTFDVSTSKAVNSNPVGHDPAEVVTSFPFPGSAQGPDVDQSWASSHEQINGGKMDGFLRTAPKHSLQPMGYYTRESLPFAYWLADEFTVGNRWFGSLPGPTYPNRRFMLAATASGCTTSELSTLIHDTPPNGTIFDQLHKHGISWANYFTDIPMTFILARNAIGHLDHHHRIDQFYVDCAAGKLPDVSFLDPRIDPSSRIGKPFNELPPPLEEILRKLLADLNTKYPGESQEDPQDMQPGEVWLRKVVTAVLDSPKWDRTCLIYIYDEHGGYYDHVPPPEAVAPDDVAPVYSSPDDPRVGYTQYGPRVPAIVVSPYSRAQTVTNVVHDHTSVLATIERKWNLPALTYRDANAADVMDFLDLSAQPRPAPICPLSPY